MPDLDAPIAAIIDATNRVDSAAFLDVFSDDAVINDWGREVHRQGRDRSVERQREHRRQQPHRGSPRHPSGDETTVTISVSGNGYNGGGSMVFTMRSGRIERLVIAG